MSYYVYPPDRSTRHEISHAIAIAANMPYNAVGKIQLTLVTDAESVSDLVEDALIYDSKREVCYIVAAVTIDTNEGTITANGYTADELLNRRAVANPAKIEVIEPSVYAAVTDNLRGLPRIATAPQKGLSETFRGQTLYGEPLLDAITPVLEHGELGRRMVWDDAARAMTFEIYKGTDRTTGIHAVTFSDERGECPDLIISLDGSTLKNVAYATYKLADGSERVATVGTATGGERYEAFFATDVSQEDGESAEACEARAKAYATMQLGKYIRRQSFAVSIDADELGTRYNIGDVVSCSSLRFGIAFNARVTDVSYQMDANGAKTSVVLGDPVLTIIGELRLQYAN